MHRTADTACKTSCHARLDGAPRDGLEGISVRAKNALTLVAILVVILMTITTRVGTFD